MVGITDKAKESLKIESQATVAIVDYKKVFVL